MKKWTGIILTMLSFILITPVKVYAAGEKESNDTLSTATAIELNSEITGALSNAYDEDYYKFTLETSGYIEISFEHKWIDNKDNCWFLFVYDSNGKNVCSAENVGWGWEGTEDRGLTAELGLEAGTYYVCIQSDVGYSSEEYTLKIEHTPAVDWETEHNDQWSLADDISLNQGINGYILYEDTDCYCLNLNNTTKIAIDFTHERLDSYSNQWEVYLYDDFYFVTKISMVIAGNEPKTVSDYVTLPAGRYWIKVIPYDVRTEVPYRLMVKEYHVCTGEWITTAEVTCTQDGAREEICTVCGILLSYEKIPSPGHAYGNWEVTKNATCSEYGSRYMTCATCGYVRTEHINMLPHDFGIWKTEKEATCTSTGKSVRSCSACGGTESKVIEKLDHVYSDWQLTEEPTCISTGKEERVCVGCGKSQNRTVEKLTYHQYGDWEVFEEATCEKDGTEKRSCIFCEETETRVIAKLGHQYDEWKQVKGNVLIPPITSEKVCSTCNDVVQSHDWSYLWVPVLSIVVLIAVLSGIVSVLMYKKRKK